MRPELHRLLRFCAEILHVEKRLAPGARVYLPDIVARDSERRLCCQASAEFRWLSIPQTRSRERRGSPRESGTSRLIVIENPVSASAVDVGGCRETGTCTLGSSCRARAPLIQGLLLPGRALPPILSRR